MTKSILLNNLEPCGFCKKTGIWKGEFHSGVCATCEGLGYVNPDGSALVPVEAIKLLKMRHNQLKREFYRIKRIAPQPDMAEFGLTLHNSLNTQYTHVKTPPLYWEPVKYGICDQCNGSGVYVGIVSSMDCVQCGTSGIVGVDSNTLAPFEQIAILGMRNKVLKRRIRILLDQDGVAEALEAIELKQIREDMR